ncbi:DUF6328 family protein [Streptomyces sp. NPDC054783]
MRRKQCADQHTLSRLWSDPEAGRTVKAMPKDPGQQPQTSRHETPEERADRNLAELLQELRVVQTGVQILFAFLLGWRSPAVSRSSMLFSATPT